MNSTKRKRTDCELGQATEAEIVRSSQFWFDDGSVVLQVENTQFCVHRSLLCRQSTVLQDLFTVPQPEDGELVDGRPIVHLADKATDWENVLGCLYNGLGFGSSLKENFPRALVSMLRLSDKYLFDEIKSFAVQQLKQSFPTIFRDWTDLKPKFHTQRHPGYEIDFINVALELQMPSILPVLFYLFLRDRDLSEIFDGTTRQDGTVASLDPRTQRVLVLGRNKILSSIMPHPFNWLLDDDIDKEVGLCCRKERQYFLKAIAPLLSRCVDYALDVSINQQGIDLNLCDECSSVARRKTSIGSRKIWDALPSYFDLPPWDVLNQNPV